MTHQHPPWGAEQLGHDAGDDVRERKVELESTRHLTARKKTELFLAGPVPFAWIRSLPSPACRLALVIRAFMYMRQTSQIVVNAEVCREAGLEGKDQRQRAIAALSKTGLFQVDRGRGRKPVVSVVDLP